MEKLNWKDPQREEPKTGQEVLCLLENGEKKVLRYKGYNTYVCTSPSDASALCYGRTLEDDERFYLYDTIQGWLPTRDALEAYMAMEKDMQTDGAARMAAREQQERDVEKGKAWIRENFYEDFMGKALYAHTCDNIDEVMKRYENFMEKDDAQ